VTLSAPRPWVTFVQDIARGAYGLHHLREDELLRAAELELRYESLEPGLSTRP
jgi:hypothetical protein